MTPTDAKKLLPFIQAYAEGKTIQLLIYGTQGPPRWEDRDLHLFNLNPDRYRIKPEPTSAPWGYDDVPYCCWIRFTRDCGRPPWEYEGKTFLVIATSNEGLHAYFAGSGERDVFLPWGQLAKECEYTTDRKTWKPCTKVVEE